jgi:hypothetical protein
MHCVGAKVFLKDTAGDANSNHYAVRDIIHSNTVDSRLSALRLNRGNVFLKKKFYFP